SSGPPLSPNNTQVPDTETLQSSLRIFIKPLWGDAVHTTGTNVNQKLNNRGLALAAQGQIGEVRVAGLPRDEGKWVGRHVLVDPLRSVFLYHHLVVSSRRESVG